MSQPKEKSSILLVIAGPAGSGKSTLCERLMTEYESVERVVTSTTRSPREGESHGVDYYFFDNATFDQKIQESAFIEWAKVHANRYGTLKSVIEEKLEQDIDLVINVDVQGVINFKKAALENELIGQRLVTVFVNVPDFEELTQRLKSRGQDDDAEIARRMETAKWELEQWKLFDYVITSTSKEEDYAAIDSVLQAEKRRTKRLA
ncbi:guanylate kinase [Puniceicoccaceae bacterium K14]|nr:guanylate kinase [Puniceicoccaceae bacterium K14]